MSGIFTPFSSKAVLVVRLIVNAVPGCLSLKSVDGYIVLGYDLAESPSALNWSVCESCHLVLSTAALCRCGRWRGYPTRDADRHLWANPQTGTQDKWRPRLSSSEGWKTYCRQEAGKRLKGELHFYYSLGWSHDPIISLEKTVTLTIKTQSLILTSMFFAALPQEN